MLNDLDGDGRRNLAEYEDATDPQDNNSALRTIQVRRNANTNQPEIDFSSVAKKLYQVQFKNDLLDPQWGVLQRVVLGNGLVNTVVDTNASTSRSFYRIKTLD